MNRLDSSARFRLLVLCTIGSSLLVPHLSMATEESLEGWVVEKAEWLADPASLATIEIRNDFGDLRVRPSDDGRVHVSAAIQRHEDDPRRAEVGRDESGDGFRIDVSFASTVPEAAETESWKRRRVDVTLFVPVGSPLVAETVRGLIEVKGVESRVEARSAWGNIVLVTSGPVVAYTERGSIDVHLRSTDWPSAAHLETLTGPITAFLPANSSVAVQMETRGLITTDFTLEVQHHSTTTLKTGKALVGQGAAQLYLSSDRGNLSLRRVAH